MIHNRPLIVLAICLTTLSLPLPSNATESTSEQEKHSALVWQVRELMTENAILKGEIKTQRADSVRIELLRVSESDSYQRQIDWLEADLPDWWEKPAFTVPVTALVVIWAVLRVVSVSI